MQKKTYVFGYGSLVDVERLKIFLGRDLIFSKDYFYCELKGYRRCWNVVRDNRIDIPSGMFYVECQSGKRFEGFVTFLNISPCSETSINGILFHVTNEDLVKLNARERHYSKFEITNQLDQDIEGEAWVYIANKYSVEQFIEGKGLNIARIAKDYYELVYDAFQSLGEVELKNYLESTDDPEIPIASLMRYYDKVDD